MTEYPVNIQIETSAFCNASCKFCPHSSRELGPSVRMSEDVFIKLVDEMATWKVAPQSICPFLTNEPFADARVYEWSRIINAKLPSTVLFFYTNGSLFTLENIEKLRTIRNIQDINISLHHSNKEDYEAELGIPWEVTKRRVAALVLAHRQSPLAKRVLLLRVSNGDKDKDSMFVNFCFEHYGNTPTVVAQRWNWKGSIESYMNYEPYLDIVCPRQQSMCILANGKVALCCMDQNSEYPLGDVNNQTLLEVYNAPLAVNYRSHIKRELVPCNKCSMH